MGCAEPPRTPALRYLDASRLFHGHEVCTDNTMVRGLYIEVGVWNENAARQSFHPNARGHGAFAECMTAFYNSGFPQATCVDPASTGHGTLYDGLFEFKQLRNAGTGKCVDGKGYDSRNSTAQQSYACHGGRNQGFWYDPTRLSLHSELSHDRCLDVAGGSLRSGAAVNVYDCHGGANQQFVFAGNQIKAAGNTALCLAFDSPLLRRHAAAAAGVLRVEHPAAVVVRVPQLPEPGRVRPRRLHRRPGLLTPPARRSWTYLVPHRANH